MVLNQEEFVKIAVALKDKSGLDSTVSSIFGRCPYFMLVDPDTKEFTIAENPAINESGGAGIKAAQFVIDQGATAVICGDVGPKASSLLLAEGCAIYQQHGKTAKDAVDAYQEGRIDQLFSSSTEGHTGHHQAL
jgi:predicted Fe-Mo cluster-binding NifX family protein